MNVLKYIFMPKWKTVFLSSSVYSYTYLKGGGIAVCELQYSSIRDK